MAKFCPSCGFRVDDDTAVFCNKCGFPFPQQQQRPSRSVVVKPPAMSPPAAQAPVRTPRRPSSAPGSGRKGAGAFFSFETLVTGRFLKVIYIAGAVLIVLFSIVGITGGFAIKGEVPANMSFTNTSAVVQHSGSSPLFWIGFLIAGSLLWRIFCEIAAVTILRQGSETAEEIPEGDEDDGYYPDEEYGQQAQYVQCPKCGKTVTTDQLRECEHCGVQGCINCIRPMGLLKKTLTCRECFERK